MHPEIVELIDLLFALSREPGDGRKHARLLVLREQLGSTLMSLNDVPLP